MTHSWRDASCVRWPSAVAVLQELLLGSDRTAPDPEHFIQAATGRGSDPDLLTRLRPRLLTLA